MFYLFHLGMLLYLWCCVLWSFLFTVSQQHKSKFSMMLCYTVSTHCIVVKSVFVTLIKLKKQNETSNCFAPFAFSITYISCFITHLRIQCNLHNPLPNLFSVPKVQMEWMWIILNQFDVACTLKCISVNTS